MFNWNILGKYDSKKDVVSTILNNRGLNAKDFLSNTSLKEYFQKMPAEFRRSLKESTLIINKAVKNNVPIVVFGDYDSDGINATAILFNFLKDEKKYKNVYYFIPNRFEHNYGLSKEAIDDVLKKYTKDKDYKEDRNYKEDKKILFVTVDVGITAYDQISYIKELGHDVIITDHHQKMDKIPLADCILWSDEICGAVISWVLTRALGSTNPVSISLACVATITDLQTITGFNRLIVKRGLEIINKKPPLGLKKLLEVSGKSFDEITSYEVGWIIGPRLNASGRLETAEDSIKLLTEKDEKVVEEMARNLNTKNIQRQEKTLEMYEIASEFNDIDEKKLPKIIFSSDVKYHEGVIGLVAAKLVQKYFRPSIVVCLTDEYGKGSARSIPGVNIIEILREYEDLFIDLGGHPMAAGFTIDKKNIKKLETKLKEYAKEKIKDTLLIPSIDIDLDIPINIVTDKLLEEIEKLKPFGIGNEQPVFLSTNLGIVGYDVIGKDKRHIKLNLYYNEKYYKAIFFGGAEYEKEFKTGDKIDLVYTLKKNEYNGNKYIDLIVKDFRKVVL